MRDDQSGNVLFLILIAVALFAGLSYTVTGASRSTGTTTEDENTRLIVSEIIAYAIALRTAITRLDALGCANIEISFERPPFDGSDTDYVNPNSPGDFSCHVFHPNGGSVVVKTPDLEWLDSTQSAQSFYGDYLYTGEGCVPLVGTGDNSCFSDDTTSELILFVPYLNRTLCQALAEEFSILSAGNIPQDGGNMWSVADAQYQGSFPDNTAVHSADNANWAAFDACIEGGGVPAAGSYHFYSVLLAR